MTDQQPLPGPTERPPAGLARTLLLLAAAVVVVESLAYFTLAALDLRDTPSERLASGLGIAVLFIAYGIGQLVAMRLLLARGAVHARPPLVVTQLLQLLVSTNLRSEPWLAWSVGVPAAVVLVILLSPPVTRALTPQDV